MFPVTVVEGNNVKNIQLSVCLITYNQVRYLEDAILSVLAQKVDVDWELIVSDDCSNDGTQDIIRKYAALHPQRIRPIIHDKNLGPFVHLIQLLGAATGEYVGYLEGDDRYTDETKLQTQIDYLAAHPECVGCFHDLSVVGENGETIHQSYLSWQGSSFRSIVTQEQLFIAGELAQTNSWVFRRRCLNNLPQWLLNYPLDKSLAFYLADFGDWGYIDRTMSLYRLHDAGIYSPLSKDRQYQMLLKHMKSLYSVPRYRERYREKILLKLSYYYRALAHVYKHSSYGLYLKYLLAYLRYKPGKISAIKVLLAEELLLRSETR